MSALILAVGFVGSAHAAVAPGEAKLIVGLDGSLAIEGGNVDLNGFTILSETDLLIPDPDGNAAPFAFYLANTSGEVTAANIGTTTNINGLLNLDASIAPEDLFDLDFVFEYGTSEGTFLGQVEQVPEPSSLALLGLGALLIARRRRG